MDRLPWYGSSRTFHHKECTTDSLLRYGIHQGRSTRDTRSCTVYQVRFTVDGSTGTVHQGQSVRYSSARSVKQGLLITMQIGGRVMTLLVSTCNIQLTIAYHRVIIRMHRLNGRISRKSCSIYVIFCVDLTRKNDRSPVVAG